VDKSLIEIVSKKHSFVSPVTWEQKGLFLFFQEAKTDLAGNNDLI